MKPISIRFRCFGPYINEQDIHFDRLAEQGLFLICGETGAGKTTILDAMCCALYGSCSGEIRGDFPNMRCKLANQDDETKVEFIFENAGRKYRFARKLSRKTEKGKVKYEEKGECQVESDGQWIPLLDNCTKTNMTKQAMKLVGFSLEQFRQVIILPQGRFETFLTSNSSEKEAILSTIFHTERWAKAVDRMNEDLKTRKAEMDRNNQTIQEGLKKWELSAVEDLPEAVEKADQEAKDAIQAKKQAKTELDLAQSQRDLNKEYERFDERQKNFNNAKKAVDEDRQQQERLNNATKAEKARSPHDEWKQAKKELNDANRQLRETEEKQKMAVVAQSQAEEDKKTHEQLKPEQENRKNEINRLVALRTRYENIETMKNRLTEATRTLKKEEKRKNSKERVLKTEESKLQELDKAWKDAEEQYTKLSKAYRAFSAGYLAEKLQEGEVCPVCGSTHHPCLAILPEDSVNAEDVEEADQQQKEARNAYNEQLKRKEAAAQAANEANGDYKKAEGEYHSAESNLQMEMEQRDPELETIEDLDQRKKNLEKESEDYDNTTEALRNTLIQKNADLNNLNDTLKEHRTITEVAKKVYEKKELAWKKALKDIGLETETQYDEMIMSADEQRKLQKEIAEHAAMLKTAETELKEQQKKIKGKPRPNSETVEQVYKDADQKNTSAIQVAALAVQKKDKLAKDTEMLTKLNEKVNEKNQKYQEDSMFVSALQGSSGISIQRYVLSIRLGQVIIEANSLLSGIYGGRYQLHRSDESYGREHKNGLELEVYDSLSDQRRSVRTLSGGEKFLVALSLAIGLCTVVQNEQRGVNLEAMFIDEGFGSLDQSALGDALDILQSVQRGRGMVGIISHVTLLEETIPTKIVIRKTDHGSELYS